MRAKGWRDRHDDVHGEGVRHTRRDCQRRLPRLHRERHDCRAGPGCHQEDDPLGEAGKTGRHRWDGQVSQLNSHNMFFCFMRFRMVLVLRFARFSVRIFHGRDTGRLYS